MSSNISRYLILFLAMIFVTACSVFGVNTTEQPSYTSYQKELEFEIRRYDDFISAYTEVESDNFDKSNNIAFRRLAKYIFGNNSAKANISMTSPVLVEQSKGQKIAMTSPVLVEKKGKKRVMSFILPKKYDLNSLPKPLDNNIKIKSRAGALMAAIRFSGLFSEDKFQDNSVKLQEWIKDNGYKKIGQPIYAGYNPPWTIPFLRRSEVLIEVARSK